MTYCARCGAEAEGKPHDLCERRLALEPPRFCAACGRRMVVQVTPFSWVATCSRHGDLRS